MIDLLRLFDLLESWRFHVFAPSGPGEMLIRFIRHHSLQPGTSSRLFIRLTAAWLIITPNLSTFFSWDGSQSCWNITALVPMTTSSRNIQFTLHIVWRWQVWCLTASTWAASSGRRSTGWRTSRCGAWSWLRGTKLMTSWQNILGKLGNISNINLAYL